MAQKRVNYQISGNADTFKKYGIELRGGYAVMTENDFCPSDAVKRSIERKIGSGFYFGTWRSDGTALSQGKPSSHHFTGTLCYGSGSVICQLWVFIDIENEVSNA